MIFPQILILNLGWLLYTHFTQNSVVTLCLYALGENHLNHAVYKYIL